MALLSEKEYYIRLKENNRVDFYRSREVRERRKKATDSDYIYKKYDEVIQDLTNQIYKYVEENNINIEDWDQEKQELVLQQHPVLKNIVDKANAWTEELYHYDILFTAHNGTDRDFPLMKEFYPDVKDSIPDIVEMVFLPLEGKSLEEKYICAKKDRYFGETKDC